MIDEIISYIHNFTDETKVKLLGDVISSATQIFLVVSASLIFPIMQSICSRYNQQRRDYITGKEKILHDLTACLPRYVANYIYYIKFCAFLINPQKETYLGLNKEKGSDILMLSMNHMLGTQQPEALLESIEAYFSDLDIKKQTKVLKEKLDSLSNICINSTCIETDCDTLNNGISDEYNKLISLMTHDLLSSIKGRHLVKKLFKITIPAIIVFSLFLFSCHKYGGVIQIPKETPSLSQNSLPNVPQTMP